MIKTQDIEVELGNILPETLLSPAKKSGIPGFSTYGHDRVVNSGRGVTILVYSIINHTQGPNSINGPNAVFVDLKHS